MYVPSIANVDAQLMVFCPPTVGDCNQDDECSIRSLILTALPRVEVPITPPRYRACIEVLGRNYHWN